MKKIICIIISILIVAAFAACGDTEKPEVSATSGIPEMSWDVDSSQANYGESGPIACLSPDEYNPANLKAENAAVLAEKLKFLAERLDEPAEGIPEQDKTTVFASLYKILAEESLFDPSYDGKHAESDGAAEDEMPVGAHFYDNGTATVEYRFQSDAVWVDVQIVYPNEIMESLIEAHGIEGYAMFLNNNEEPVVESVPAEIAQFGYDSVSIETVTCDGKQYTAMKCSVGDGSRDAVYFVCDGKVIAVSCNYIDPESKNEGEILEALKLEKLSFDKNTVPAACVSPTEYEFRSLSADSDDDLYAKLCYLYTVFASERAKPFNKDETEWFSVLSDIVNGGWFLNPSCGGVYAEKKEDETVSPISVTYTGFIQVTYYCRRPENGDSMLVNVHVTYPNQELKHLTDKNGIKGYQSYIYADQEAYYGEKVNITVDGKTFEAYKQLPSEEGDVTTVSFLYEGKVVSIEYKYTNGENADGILDMIKLEKVYIGQTQGQE